MKKDFFNSSLIARCFLASVLFSPLYAIELADQFVVLNDALKNFVKELRKSTAEIKPGSIAALLKTAVVKPKIETRNEKRYLDLAGRQLTSLEGLDTIPDIDWGLVTINLSNNNLTIIKAKDFQLLATIETLNLSANAITTIEDGAFKDLTSMAKLNLSNNKLTMLRKEWFGNDITKLREINLSNNGLASAVIQNFATVLGFKQDPTNPALLHKDPLATPLMPDLS